MSSDWEKQLVFVERIDMPRGPRAGYSLFVYEDPCVGGCLVYFSDNIGGGVRVFNEALDDPWITRFALADFERRLAERQKSEEEVSGG